MISGGGGGGARIHISSMLYSYSNKYCKTAIGGAEGHPIKEFLSSGF